MKRTLLPILSLFFLSFSSLAMEITLMRFFSVLFNHSYVYLLISLVMAGLGFGTLLLYFMNKDAQRRYFKWIIFLPLVTFLILLVSNFLYVSIMLSLFLTLLLFMYVGSSTTFLFQKAKVGIAVLYFIDLSGAALGSVGSVFLLNSFGAVRSLIILMIILSSSLCTLYFSFFQNSLKAIAAWTGVTAISVFLLFIDTDILVLPSHNLDKDMINALHNRRDNIRIIDSKWSSFGRSDLLETDNDEYKTLFIDGAAGTKMVKLESGIIDQKLKSYLKNDFVAGIPLNLLPDDKKKDALIIGSGGGIDVVTLLAHDFEKITAVEINPDFIDVVKKYGDYNGNIYNNHPRVDIINREGRSYLRTSSKKFDVILISLPLIKSARNYSSYALTENYLFTYDAFREYEGALKEDGYLIIVVHDIIEIYRIVSNAVKSYAISGMATVEAMKHMMVIGRDKMPAFIMKKSPFTPEETDLFHRNIIELNQLGKGIFIPNLAQHTMVIKSADIKTVIEEMLNNALYLLSSGGIDLDAFISHHPSNISYISDNSPFFYNFSRAIPPEISGVFIISLIILFAFLLLYHGKLKNHTSSVNGRYLFSFGILGFAFIITEIGVIQKFLFFWGQQTIALAAVLSMLLFSTGTGSLTAIAVKNDRLKLKISLIMIPFFIALFYHLSKNILTSFDDAPLSLKTVLSILLIFPLFFFMGFPFPTLLKNIRSLRRIDLFPWMIGMNSLSTLLGGVVAIITAMVLGYQFVLFAGGIFYALLFFFIPISGRKN